MPRLRRRLHVVSDCSQQSGGDTHSDCKDASEHSRDKTPLNSARVDPPLGLVQVSVDRPIRRHAPIGGFPRWGVKPLRDVMLIGGRTGRGGMMDLVVPKDRPRRACLRSCRRHCWREGKPRVGEIY